MLCTQQKEITPMPCLSIMQIKFAKGHKGCAYIGTVCGRRNGGGILKRKAALNKKRHPILPNQYYRISKLS
ncbi:hypothetical protein XENTR_v10008393 [Xenopus tropicalis]|nr:hypothetical protein XENTR_v10008393 [Xenopus tropicalis]